MQKRQHASQVQPIHKVVTSRDKLTVKEILQDLADEDGKPLARSTWEEWRAKGTGPRCIKLPNGQLRVRRAEYERWLAEREAA